MASNTILLKGKTSAAGAPDSLELRELAVNTFEGKLYSRRGNDIVSIAGGNFSVIFSDASPTAGNVYLILSAEEDIELIKIHYTIDQGTLTDAKLKRRVFNQPSTEGSGLFTIVTFDVNNNINLKDLTSSNETEVLETQRFIYKGDGLILNTGILSTGTTPKNFTLQIIYRMSKEK